MQESLSFTEEKYKTNLENVDRKQENISLKIATTEEENWELSTKIKDSDLEAYSRRGKIKFENINEFEEDTEQVLRLFMETELCLWTQAA